MLLERLRPSARLLGEGRSPSGSIRCGKVWADLEGEAKDRDAMLEGIRDGSVDVIAPDHAPHHADEKHVEYDRAPFGIVGLETAGAVPRVLEMSRRQWCRWNGLPTDLLARSPFLAHGGEPT